MVSLMRRPSDPAAIRCMSASYLLCCHEQLRARPRLPVLPVMGKWGGGDVIIHDPVPIIDQNINRCICERILALLVLLLPREDCCIVSEVPLEWLRR